ncbi:bone morphogenetic protein receptor type-2-like isoform X2 [Mugil cephalus]|uniref:bone morphogenetic protein receptor type-2-like isoform X2 n=1 Tax=Mugil cephalus TaxID=48193 RepID=UPI001FB5C09A|nr:bone morphogenetic protein receptor type-2-like isoform X2 [Mugil cephalus]
MAASSLMMCVCVLLLPPTTGFQSEDGEDRLCAFTDNLQGAEPPPTNELRGEVLENTTIRCSRGSRCYGLWEKRADGEMQLINQGCWTHVGNQQECHGSRCVLVMTTPSQVQNVNYRFCCCSRDLCNANFTEAPPTADAPALRPMRTAGRGDSDTGRHLTPEETALVALVTVAVAAILIMAMFLGYRMIKRKQKHSLSAVNVIEATNTESGVDMDNLKLLELIGRGRYGAVFRGFLNERCVAVKLFSSANWQNYANERAVYFLPLLQQHDNIAHFMGADGRTAADGRPEFLILLEYYPHGCLSQYLSVHTVDWLTCCRMTHGITRGLAFLHTDIHRGDQYKPAVAHRDLTSRNVLVRADLSCVLADFGLSMRLTGTQPCCPGDDDTVAISEVGTARYMSPEVLGGALNLRDFEAALKQVDVYSLGLIYWESFRRCSALYPGEAVPEFQLAFQAELGNHPSFEDMQNLVVREKYRPRFPDAWKENSLALRSLKETMEDCWDQDAEARLTAQCAEERLSELTLLSLHNQTHNHRNLSHGRWTPPVGSASSYIEDRQVGVVKNLQGDGYPASVIRTTTSCVEGVDKNRSSINLERQQNRTRLLTSDSVGAPASVLSTVSTSHLSGGAVPRVQVCLQLMEEDLEAAKLDPKEVGKNLRETSDENLMEHSQKRFGSDPQTSTLLPHQRLLSPEANNWPLTPQTEPGVVGGVVTPPSSSIHPLPKQQNLPQRPTSLHLPPKTKEARTASSQVKLGKLRSNHQQVETGVAKMNTVTAVTASEPHLLTTITMRNSTGTGIQVHAGAPTLVKNAMIGGGRTNPAGPQEEDEKIDGGRSRQNLLNFSPDEHEPLLRSEQLPAESQPPPPLLHHHHHMLTRRGSNSNNNNNRLVLGSDLELEPPPGSQPRGGFTSAALVSDLEDKDLLSGHTPHPQVPHTVSGTSQDSDSGLYQAEAPGYTQNPKDPKDQLVPSAGTTEVPDTTAPPSGSTKTTPEPVFTEEPGTQEQQPQDDGLTLPSTAHAQKPPPPAVTASDPEATCEPVSEPQTGLLQSNVRPSKARRPERPCSLDLSSSCISSGDFSLADNGSLSASGEKIKRRVKTPYTLKKWRPASWVISSDAALDLDFEFNTTSSSFSSDPRRAGSTGVPRINQSKSSMAVFLVEGGATETTTSEPDGMTSF